MSCILYLLPFLFFFVDACPNGTQVSSVNKSICYDVRESAKGHTWYAAEYQCQLYDNGHLASIPDAFTNNFITGYLHSTQSARHFWVGGTTTLSSNASWTWSDGADFKYNSWDFGGPGNGTGYCTLLVVPEGLWDSYSCFYSSSTVLFLCEFLNTDNF